MPDFEKLTLNDPETQSADIVAGNVVALQALFPEAFSEGRIDFEVLKQVLGGEVDDREEKYGLNWHGKRRARQIALTPSTGTLLPCPQDSVDWDTTQNLMIEGDNLEVLKLLQKSYAGEVKMIYIDPPYNTGSDFVYPDDFRDGIKNYLKVTGQTDDGGNRITSNSDSSGRFHTEWLNMIYPRLKVARGLLRDDGVIFISIHHVELQNMLRVCDEIYGEENRVAIITWKARVKPVNIGEAKYRPQAETDYVVVYQKSDKAGKFKPLFTGGVRSYPHALGDRRYRLQTILKSNRGGNFRSTMSFELNGYAPPEGQRWQGGDDEIHRLDSQGYIEFRDGTPFRRYFEDEEGAEHDPFYCFMEVDWSSTSEAGKHELNSLMGDDHGFDTVKPTRLIKTLIQSITDPLAGEVVMDFFAGSGTTGHALMSQNLEDNGNRRCILVQLPEPLDVGNKDQQSTARFCGKIGKPLNIAEVTKERLRRSGVKLRESSSEAPLDIGFRVYKLASSNIRAWEPVAADLENTLLAHAEHLVQGRTEADVLTELLLKLGLDLCVPIEQKQIAGKMVHSIGAGALIACLSDGITRDVAEELGTGIAAWRKALNPAVDTRVVFKDSGFADNDAKLNMAAILTQAGITDMRSL
jgi:adenine-specific DNA-methyltransferase